MIEMWHLISKTPQFAVGVEFYYGNAVFRDQNDNLVELPPYRDERRELGYWDGEAWRHSGTGHRIYEFGDENPEWLPTHWRVLDAPPQL